MTTAFLPKAFESKMRGLLESDFDDFWSACQTKSPRTVRANSFKISVAELKEIFENHQIQTEFHPAFENVLTIKTPRIQIGKLNEHRLGWFVVQDVSSMIPALVLNPAVGDLVLDLAAAPGMKTCQMAERMQNHGAIVAVDENRERLKGLRFNLNRLGIINTLVVQGFAESFGPRLQFD